MRAKGEGMFVVVTGGSGSGKSAFAEQRVVDLGAGVRIYLATMQCADQESKRRIARHRLMRKDRNFITREQYTGLHNLSLPKDAVILLECMSNLVANEMYLAGGAGGHCVEQIMEGLLKLREHTRHQVIVTNEVFSDGIIYDEETKRYQRYLGRINQAMSTLADEVVEVVYGIPLYLKRKADPR